MDVCILELGGREFRLLQLHVDELGGLDIQDLGTELVSLGESIDARGAVARVGWLSALSAGARLVQRARAVSRDAHLIVVACEAVASARNAEGFFVAFRRMTGVTPEELSSARLARLVASATEDHPRFVRPRCDYVKNRLDP